MEHQKFNFRSLEELKETILRLGVELPFSERLSDELPTSEGMGGELPVSERLDVLKTPLLLGSYLINNRIAIHPMEGCDGTADGTPGELTFRRYERFGASGAGLLWVEACAVNHEGRGNARHLYLNRDSLPSFKKLFNGMMAAAKPASENDFRLISLYNTSDTTSKADIQSNTDHQSTHSEQNGNSITFRPYTVLQLTHSGRYSKPSPDATAVVAVCKNPYLDPYSNPKRRLVTDEELERLEDLYVETAQLAKEVGFDAVDVKCCHRYLISELLSAHTREGRYGGSFKNRVRFLLNIIDKLKANVEINVVVRFNAYDAIPYPYGWGTDENGRPALDEPRRLMQMLWEKGVRLVNITTGNPYYNPHIGRPADIGPYIAAEHPVESAARMLHIIKEMKAAATGMTLVGTGFSWFREYGANIAAGCIEKGWLDIAGFGRQSFAYPDFARDIFANGAMSRNKCCVTCTKCTELMRFGGQTGCIVRDSKIYLPLWREATKGRTMMSAKIAHHV